MAGVALAATTALAAAGCHSVAGLPPTATVTPIPPTTTPLPTPVPTVRLIFTGDIIPSRCVYARQQSEGDFTFAFQKMAPLLASADIAVGSLDASLSAAGAPIGCTPTFDLLAPPQSIEGLTYSGFDVMTIASNHAKDCGQAAASCDQAVLDTVANLHNAGIATAGGGANLAEARKPAIVAVNGIRFAFLGYDDVANYYNATDSSPGTAPLDSTTLAGDVRAAKAQADIVIVMPHWGSEYTLSPTARQQEMAHLAIDSGATLVVGNHPHWAQATENLGNKFIDYALGNFVFDQDWSIETQQGLVMAATFQGKQLVKVELFPIRIDQAYQPALASPEEGAQILDRIASVSTTLPPAQTAATSP
jgi:poly-gamma-glutamate capsule biosynthesis protein CapA/YwtB (metallophosphatase superfamily)